jgi:formamidopyrimidine-DNA glycosylase
MPELPEVETIKNELSPRVLGRSIKSVDVFWDKMVRRPSLPEFRRRVIGQKITRLSRRGKYLFFHLEADGVLVMHMKMTGSLLVDPTDDKFSRAVFYLDDGAAVHFRDPRKFGVMWLADDESDVDTMLGPEPFDKGFTPATLAKILKNRTAPVKAVIIDQSVIAGIGNMYADEALFAARIHPLKPAGQLSADEIEKLHTAIRRVLGKALKKGGASVRNYIRPDGAPGTAHDEFVVAHGVGKKCPGCGGPIQRIVVRGRGTYICPRCQRL